MIPGSLRVVVLDDVCLLSEVWTGPHRVHQAETKAG